MTHATPAQGDVFEAWHIWQQYCEQNQVMWSGYVRDTLGAVAAPGDAQRKRGEPFVGLQQVLRTAMRDPLSFLNMPTGDDVSSIGESVAEVKAEVAHLAARTDVAGLVASMSELQSVVVALRDALSAVDKRCDCIEQSLADGGPLAGKVVTISSTIDDLNKCLAKLEQGVDSWPDELERKLGKFDRQLGGVDAATGEIKKDLNQLSTARRR